MKKKLSQIEEILDKTDIDNDVIKYKILPYVKFNEEERIKMVKLLNNSIFTIFFPKKNKSLAIIIRYNPRDKKDPNNIVVRTCQMLVWNLETNEIIRGQWLFNKKVLVQHSDVSADGKYFIYAMQHPKAKYNPELHEYLTIISKPPYFSGLYVLRVNRDKDAYDNYYYEKRVNGGLWILNDKDEYQLKFADNYLDQVIRGKLPEHIKIYKMPDYDENKRKSELEKLKAVELKEILVSRNLAKTGIKYDLVRRIMKDEIDNYYEDVKNIKKLTNKSSMRYNLPCKHEDKDIDIFEGCLRLNGKIIYDFTEDIFVLMPPPKDYDW